MIRRYWLPALPFQALFLCLLATAVALPAAPADASQMRFHVSEASRESLSLGAHLPLPSKYASSSGSNGAIEVKERAHYQLAVAPNDPFYVEQWYLSNVGQSIQGNPGIPGADVGAESAWPFATGVGQVVAAIDTGVQLDHPDLAANIWTNSAEIINGVDDDGNGYIDDVNGWNFIDNTADLTDHGGHGTIIAGEISAVANNGEGISGLAPGSRIMSLKTSDSDNVDVVKAARAITYAANLGVSVVNASFGGPMRSNAMRLALARNPGTLLVTAAGNDNADVESKPVYPCSLPDLNIICVAATDSHDRLASFSNYGRNDVDIAAPGEMVGSTYPGSQYVYADGTSMAAPLVAAAAALVKQRFPRFDAYQVRQKLLYSAIPLGSLGGLVRTSARLSAAAALAESDGIKPRTILPRRQQQVFGKRRFAVIKYRATQKNILMECRLRKGPWLGCSEDGRIHIDTHFLRNRRYTLQLRAIGADGDAEQRPVQFHFQVDKRKHRR